MTLQEFIDFDQFVRCYCVGQEEVMIMPYDPRKAYLSGEQYINDPNYLSDELRERVTKDVRTLCTALGYDLNTVEFAIKDGIPYAIDFMNPAPDAELISVGEFYHNWVTEKVTDLVFKRLSQTAEERPRYRWDAFLNPHPIQTNAVASAVEQAARTIIPQPVREIPADIAAGVSELVSDAASAVTVIVESVTEPKAQTTKNTKRASTAPKSKPAARKAAAPKARKATPGDITG
jgi:hypothetical protein